MPNIQTRLAFATDVGRKRKHNEDFTAYFEPKDEQAMANSGCLYIVADGVGGGAAGEVASKYAAQKVLFEYYRDDEADLGQRLAGAVQVANADLFNHVQQNPEMGRMGTTMVAAVLRESQFAIVNVGDSRAYLLREGEMAQITRDHSLVAKLVEEGSLTVAEAEDHPRRNVLLRSLGSNPVVYADIFDGDLHPGDSLILCSDGLTRHVQDSEIQVIVAGAAAGAAVHELIALANERGGRDNISVLILKAEAQAAEFKRSTAGSQELDDPDIDELLDSRPSLTPKPEEAQTKSWRKIILLIILCVLALLIVAWFLPLIWN